MSIPPIHPVLVHLPIAFVLLSVIADFCARLAKHESRRAIYRVLGFWCLAAGCVGAFLAIAAGYWDLSRATLDPSTDALIGLHMTLGWTLAFLLLILTGWRWLIWHRGQMTINTSYLVMGSLILGLTLFQGWYGSEMVYGYGAGVAVTGQGTEHAESAQRRLGAIQGLFGRETAMGGGDIPGGTNQWQSNVESSEDNEATSPIEE